MQSFLYNKINYLLVLPVGSFLGVQNTASSTTIFPFWVLLYNNVFPEADQKSPYKCQNEFDCLTASLISIDTKDPDLVHVWEFGYNQDDHSDCVEEKHWVLIICCMWCYQIPVCIYPSKNYFHRRNTSRRYENRITEHIKPLKEHKGENKR